MLLCFRSRRGRDRERERVRAAPSINDLYINRHIADLFHDAVREISQRRRFPINISSLNDIMRGMDHMWHVGRATGGTFSQLCRFFEREGLVMLDQRNSSVMLM